MATFPTWRNMIKAMEPPPAFYSFEILRAKLSNLHGGRDSLPVQAVQALIRAAGENIECNEGRYMLTEQGKRLNIELNTSTT